MFFSFSGNSMAYIFEILNHKYSSILENVLFFHFKNDEKKYAMKTIKQKLKIKNLKSPTESHSLMPRIIKTKPYRTHVISFSCHFLPLKKY